MEKTYLITGGFGHLGSTIAKQLLEKGENVVVTDIQVHAFPKEYKNLTVVICDITKIDELENVFEKALEKTQSKDLSIIHCAGIVSITAKNDKKVFDVNVGGTNNVIKLCKKYKVEKLVYVSSVHAIKENKNGEIIKETTTFDPYEVEGQYAQTKAIATKMVLEETKAGLNAVIVHPSGIIGPRDTRIGHTTRLFIDFLSGKLTAAITGGYDFVDVRDVSQGILQALEKGKTGECYILSNRFVTIKELLNLTAQACGKKPITTYLPLWFIKPLLPLAELYYKVRKVKPLFTSYSLSTLKSNAIFSHEKASCELGYNPRPLEDTINDTIQWIKDFKEL